MTKSQKIDLIYKLCSDLYDYTVSKQLKELGIDPKLPENQIKKKLRELLISHHPDHNKNDPMKEKAFKHILSIYEAVKLINNQKEAKTPTSQTSGRDWKQPVWGDWYSKKASAEEELDQFIDLLVDTVRSGQANARQIAMKLEQDGMDGEEIADILEIIRLETQVKK